jgi:hypothetical protein
MTPRLAALLGAGWLVLSVPDGKPVTTPLAEWSRAAESDTAYECERQRRELLRAWLQKTGRSPYDGESRHRCVRVEQVSGRKK